MVPTPVLEFKKSPGISWNFAENFAFGLLSMLNLAVH